MGIVQEIHLGVAYLVVLGAIVFSWNSMGRRVMVALTGLQVGVGIVLAGIAGASHVALPPIVGLHIVLALLAMGAYIVARRMGDRPNGSAAALGASLLGIVLIVATIYLGFHMAGRV